jgi:hypothetical protein
MCVISRSGRDSLSRWVRETAAERGRSERTVWRWVAQARASGDYPVRLRACACPDCKRILPEESTRRRLYCDDACRMRAHRAHEHPRPAPT